MSWREIPGNPYWNFKDDPVPTKLQDLWENMAFIGGVRTDGPNQIFAQVRRVGDSDDANRGEMSATYWNAKVGVFGVQPPSYYDSLPTVDVPDNLYIPSGADALITADGNFFLVSPNLYIPLGYDALITTDDKFFSVSP